MTYHLTIEGNLVSINQTYRAGKGRNRRKIYIASKARSYGNKVGWQAKANRGFYYQPVTEQINNDGDMFELLDILAKDLGILGIFSDWPATVTFYANYMGLKINDPLDWYC